MVDPQASRFWLAALQSGLLNSEGLTACWNAIPPEKRDAVEHLDRRLARQAVQLNYLSLWQAQQLLAGRSSGFRVDRYLLMELIGHGGMGRVYLARDTRLNRLVALKILSPERMNNPRAIARFQREARVGAQLQHENLVRIYDFGESNGRFFLVMEYIEGKTIGALITAQGPMPWPTAARLTRQIALGLEHAHRKGLIHRDVNPYNILVTHEGIAKLADLGLAIDLAEEERVTRDGATVGTFDYVAPEQARHSHSADIRSDIYSLGCSLYHMLSGQVPFPSPSLPEKLFAHQALEPAPISQFVPEVPAALVEVVQRMIRKLPAERYATPLQAAQALEPFLDDYARSAEEEPTPDHDAAPPAPPAPIPMPMPMPSGDQLVAAVIARPDQPGPPPAADPQPLPAVDPERPALVVPSILTPVDDDGGGAEDVPLILDLGPEPPLVDASRRSWSLFGGGDNAPQAAAHEAAATTPTTARGASVPARLRAALASIRRRLGSWGAAVGVLVAVVLAGMALASWFGQGRGGTGKARPGTEPESSSEPRAAREKTPGQTGGGAAQSTLTVLDADGAESPASDLSDAIRRAMGTGGWVVFHNRAPLKLNAAIPPLSSPTTATLKLRAAKGAAPVLAIELDGARPFLMTGSSLNLTCEGLTLIIRHSPPAGSTAAAAPPAPMILAGGAAQFRRCSFETDSPSPLAGTRAIVADGGNLTVENCWFRGFSTGIEVRARGGATALLRQTMIVQGPRQEKEKEKEKEKTAAPASVPAAASAAPAAGLSGWALRVEFLGGGPSPARRLVLDHCTISGEGLVQLAGFSPESPLQVEAMACAVQTQALVCWEPASPGASWRPGAVRWRGERNLLDIAGPWILWRSGSAPRQATEVHGLEAWSQWAGESNSEAGGIRFPTAPEAGRKGTRPSDFAVLPPGSHGADSGQVGPESARPDSTP